MVHITFFIDYKTNPGQVIRLCGSAAELGEWEGGYIMSYHDGKCVAELDINTMPFEFKFQIYNVDRRYVEQWESCGNRIVVLTKQADEIIVESVWNCPDDTRITAKKSKVVKSSIKKSCSMEFSAK